MPRYNKEQEEEQEETIEVTEAPQEQPINQETINTPYGNIQTQGTNGIKILRRIYNHVEDAMNRIDREQRHQNTETPITIIDNLPETYPGQALREAQHRIMQARMTITALRGTLESIKQDCDTLQRTIREEQDD